ncbi:MAG: 1-aminocyclopropane-1-carboxylate deaminase [Oleiphilus sp.]|nr:MAG: 1-aminocyclopropane-1-carboxylate deaminase [Oleiphilus sp.]
MLHPLFESIPELADKIPVLRFANCPTPVEHFTPSVTNDPGNLWIKRDDLTHPDYGGNKVRKLEFILAELLQSGARELVTFGAIGTNHGVATALFCKQFEIAVTVYLFDQPLTPTVTNNLLCMQALGADLRYRKGLARAALAFYLSKFASHRSAYHLFAGGSNIAGCIGYVNAAYELKAQILEGECPEPDIIICPVGSSATTAGLTLGCRLAGLNTRVVGVRVAPSHLGLIPTCTTGTIQQLIQQTHKALSQHCLRLTGVAIPEPVLEQNYFGEGYGHRLAAGDEAQDQLIKHGIRLDPTYTAKAAACALDYCRAHPQEKILYWHTFSSADTTHLRSRARPEMLPLRLQNSMLKQ